MPLVEPVITEPREHVDVEVPHVLVTCRFVVLTRRDSLAVIREAHGLGYLGRDAVVVEMQPILRSDPWYVTFPGRIGGLSSITGRYDRSRCSTEVAR